MTPQRLAGMDTTAWARLDRALDGFDPSDQLAEGSAALYRMGRCDVILRAAGEWLEVVAVGGQDALAALRLVYSTAKMAGYKGIRFWSKRPALVRYAREFGPFNIENERGEYNRHELRMK